MVLKSGGLNNFDGCICCGSPIFTFMKKLFGVIVFAFFLASLQAMSIRYTVSFPNPEDHYVHVSMTIPVKDSANVNVYMPVWTPGSYMVREFSRHVDQVNVKDLSGKPVSFSKVNKNTWNIITEGLDSVVISYRVYAFEMTVRTSHVDADHAMLNGASIFLGMEGMNYKDHLVEIIPHPSWKYISTALKAIDGKKWIRNAESYDVLVDSPIEIGNHEVIDFSAGGIPHQLAFIGPSNADRQQLIADLTKIVDVQVAMFGATHPCDEYLFILHNTDNIYGGLEHAFSSLNMLPRWDYAPRSKYLKSISLLSHEYFHLWNVKRIRPYPLRPFDYNAENYTRQLWLAEGVTSYYDDYFVYRAGISTREEFLAIVADNLNRVVNNPGDAFQSLGESSFDTWIKFYRQHENTWNNQVHYYTKGGMVMTALNFLIMSETKGEKSLDDVMRKMMHRYYGSLGKGFNEAKVRSIFEEVAGFPLSDFFEKHIYGTVPIDYAAYFDLVGLELIDLKDKEGIYQGWTLGNKEGRWVVSKVELGYGAYQSGVNAEDEILAINGFRMGAQWESFLHGKKPGDEVDVLLSRAGMVRTIKMKLTADQRSRYKIIPLERPSAEQMLLREKWLKVN
jgi:predicted metalloprotease with PDZ domain